MNSAVLSTPSNFDLHPKVPAKSAVLLKVTGPHQPTDSAATGSLIPADRFAFLVCSGVSSSCVVFVNK